MVRLVIIVVVVLCCFQSAAQQLLFRNYTVAEGLPSSTVRAITQDRQGYLWFGTKNGLSRFDGYQFKNFQFTYDDPQSLGNNFIHCVAVIDSATIWIGTEKGIWKMDLKTEKFSRFEPVKEGSVYDILSAPDGWIWISTRFNGLVRYHPVTDKLERFKSDGTSATITGTTFSKLTVDHEGNIWIGTYGHGLAIYNSKAGSFSSIRFGEKGLSSDYINSVSTGKDGTIWVGTMNGGLCRWDQEKDSFYVYKRDGGTHSIQDNIVRSVTELSNERILIGTEKGLNLLDLKTDLMTSYSNNNVDPFSISDNSVYTIFPDRSGTVWVGTFFGGVNYFKENGSAFELFYPNGNAWSLKGRAVSCFLEDRPGWFWVGTEDAGLFLYEAATGKFNQYPFKAGQEPLSYHNIHTLLKDREGNIWIGIYAGGVQVLNPATGRVRKYRHEAGNEYSINSNNVFSLSQDRDGIIWIGTDMGLHRYHPERNRFERIDYPGVKNSIIYDVYEDAAKTLWIATYNHGLCSYSKKTGKWNQLTTEGKTGSLASVKLTSLLDDNNGNLWIGSDGGGLHKYNFQSKKMKIYNQDAGLNGNLIYGIQQDDAGLIWVTSNNGIYSLDPVKEKLQHFTRQDNLQSQQFNYRAFYKASDGKMMAGGIKGFNTFYPDQLRQYAISSQVSIINFQLFNKTISPAPDGSPLAASIQFTKELELSHDQSVISFEYAAVNTGSSEKLSYAYLMQGFDKDWNYVNDQRKATYTNLSPGTYHFRVKASLEEGNWEVPETIVKLVIHPPFYKSSWAYLLYMILLILLGYGVYRYSVAYIRKKNQIRLERLKNKEEQEFYARKIEFFTVMAHEIRTPLSLIIAPLEKLLSLHKWDGVEKQQLQVMDENAERLMGLVNQLLDFRRIESDAYEIRKEPVEIVSAVQAVYSRFSAIPYQKNIEFTLSTRINNRIVEADPEVINKILSNLLINAFKFARTRVGLSVLESTRQDTGQRVLSIRVEDDGIGIPEANLTNIFTQFFTTSKGADEYHNLGGSGIGLALASSLAEKHGAQLHVKSREGVKTVFTLELPVHLPEKIQPVAQETRPAAPSDPEWLQVLLVEDDTSILDFLVQSFQAACYNVLTAANGREALKLVEEKEIDLIVSDWMMPEMDGVEFCKQLKKDISYSHIPFILLTAKGSREAEIEGIETGADAYLMKPFKWKHLAAVAKNLVDSRQQLRKKFAEQPQSEVSVLTTNVQDREFMERVVKIIEKRIMDTQFSVEELSRDLAMSRSSLHKKLKSLSGYVPNELIKLVKLKHAAKLLQEGSHTIAEVAYLSGFNSPSYFSKCFLQQFQLSPKEYADKVTGKGTMIFKDIDLG